MASGTQPDQGPGRQAPLRYGEGSASKDDYQELALADRPPASHKLVIRAITKNGLDRATGGGEQLLSRVLPSVKSP